MSLSPAQMRIAARMCDDRKVEMRPTDTPDEIEAGAWLFDNGIFFLGPEGCALCAKILREEADKQERAA